MNRRIWLVVLFLGFFPAWAFQEMSLAEVERLMTETADAMRADMANSKAVDASTTEQVRSLVGNGVRAHQEGAYETALEHYEKALKLNPLDFNAHYESAFTLSMLARHPEALQAAIRAQVIDPDSEHPYVLEANVLDNLGFVSKAIEVYRQLLEHHPKSIMGYINLGVSLVRSGDSEAGKQAWQKAIEIDPDHPSAYYQLANLAKNRGEEFEEEKYLKLFIEKGQNDRRLPLAEKRLEELNGDEITVNADNPYMVIDMMAQMTRSLWKKDKFLEKFPDKKGYEPSMEEELEVHNLILKLWKEEKEKDATAAHPSYDLLFKADEAGQFEAAVYALSQAKLPQDVAAYFQEDLERTEAFLAWGRETGLVRTPDSGSDEEAAETKPVTAAAVVMTQLQESEIAYQMVPGSPELFSVFKIQEAKRYQEGLVLEGSNRIDGDQVQGYLKNLNVMELSILLSSLSYVLPGEAEWEIFIAQLSRVNLRMKEREIPDVLPGGLGEKTTQVLLDMDHMAWMPYWCAKAGFANEPVLRKFAGMKGDYGPPTVEEEILGFTAAIQAYINTKESEDFLADPFFEFLEGVYQNKGMEGFVLFEVIHCYYGVRLTALSRDQRKAVETYLLNFALENLN